MNSRLEVIKEILSVLDDLQENIKYTFSTDRKQIPKASGLYLIYSQDQLLYVGETDNLQRRLLGDHKSSNIKGSAFRKALKKYKKLADEKSISEYIMKNCSFQFIEFEDKKRRKRLEHFAIAVLNPILNE